MPFGMLACQNEKLAPRLPHWHAKLKIWQAFDMLARKLNNWHTFGKLPRLLALWPLKMKSWHAFGMWARRPCWHV